MVTVTLIPDFKHQHFAHCESGVMSALLQTRGISLSEPMVFGLSGAMSFAYLPFLKFGNMPLVSYRMFPGHIVKKFPKQLGITCFRETYKDPDLAMAELDAYLEKDSRWDSRRPPILPPISRPKCASTSMPTTSSSSGRKGKNTW